VAFGHQVHFHREQNGWHIVDEKYAVYRHLMLLYRLGDKICAGDNALRLDSSNVRLTIAGLPIERLLCHERGRLRKRNFFTLPETAPLCGGF
ncbi:MAG: hypothetical protein AB1631_05155, partial [Acidobacteriota bacterium]